MSTMLTELMQQLQDVYTHHPGDDGRVIVAVPTTPHTVEQFEVGEVHHDGPSVVLCCQPLQEEQPRPSEEQPRRTIGGPVLPAPPGGTGQAIGRTAQAPRGENPDLRP